MARLNRSRVSPLLLLLLFFVIHIAFGNLSSAEDDNDRPRPQRAPEISINAETLETIVETVLKRHIAPPTRQEMIRAIVSDYGPLDRWRPGELSALISDIESKEKLYEFLREQLQARATQTQEPIAGLLENDQLSQVIVGDETFVSKKEREVQEQLAANRYVGIGVQLTMGKLGHAYFAGILPGGTAESGGVLHNDRLLAIDGQAVGNKPLAEIIDLLRGPEGSELTITVQAVDNAEGSTLSPPRQLSLTRRVVPIRSVAKKLINDEGTAVTIAIDRVSASTVSELRDALEELPDEVKHVNLLLNVDSHNSLHNMHLLADALLDAGVLGRIERRSGVQVLRLEDGTVLGERTCELHIVDPNPPVLHCLIRAAQKAKMKVTFSNGAPPGVSSHYLHETVDFGNNQTQLSLATGVLKW